MERKLRIVLRDGTAREFSTYGGLVRTGGENCSKKDSKYGCRGCQDYLC